MKETSKEDYIEISCKRFCDSYETCDKSHIFITRISDKTTSIGCSAYKKREDK